MLTLARFACLSLVLAACAETAETPEDGEHDPIVSADTKEDSVWFVEDYSWESEAVLRLVNSSDYDALHDDVGLSYLPAKAIADAKKPITSLTALDDISWVGPLTFAKLRGHAVDHGYGPALAEEYPPANEEQAIEDTTQAITSMMMKRYASGAMPRGQHAKAHGCVAATVHVDSSVPAALRAGMFASPGDLRAIVRFSNGDSTLKADGDKDVRGMAIKVIGVTGPKALPDDTGTTQDFLLINHPTLMVRNVLKYGEMVTRANSGNQFSIITFFLSLNPADWEVRGLVNLLGMVSHKIANPLESRYWTTTPYLLGDKAVKYSARPCTTPPEPSIPAMAPDSYLRDALTASLASSSACFELMAQVQTDPRTMPIEDPTVEWKEASSPFVKVATIQIPSQQFNSPDQVTACENLTYTPWHALASQRPLGGINRARKAAYRVMTIARHFRNGASVSEPQ
jgi:hypothetical protein